MAGYVEELAAFLGWEVDSKELEAFDKHAESVTNTIKGLTFAVTTAAAAMSAWLVKTNDMTAENVAMANAVGLSVESLEAFKALLKPMEFDAQRVVDLVEEMNNKMGESTGLGKPMTAVAEGVKILGLEFESLKKLKPEDQFISILDAATKLDDAQQAVSAVDMIMGGEANKIVGFLRAQNTGLLEQLNHYTRLNMLTEEGRAGAVAFDKSLRDFLFSVQSISSEIAGLTGGVLQDLIKGWIDWIKENRELIKSKIRIWVERLTKAIKWLWTWGKRIWGVIMDLVDAFGGLEGVLKTAGILIGAMITSRAIMMIAIFTKGLKAAGLAATLMNLAVAATPLIVAGVVLLLGLLAEDLYQFFTGGESLLGEIGDKIAEFAHMNIRPFIASLMGMTPEEFDMALVKVVGAVTKFITEDIPNAWQLGVDTIEGIIKFAVEDLWPVILQIYDFFVQVFDKILTLVSETVGKIKDRIVNSVKDAISSIGGVSGASIKDVISGQAAVAAKSAMGIGPGAQLSQIIQSSVNKARSSVQQQNTINVTQQPGENGEALARRMRDMLGQELNRAVKSASSGIE